MNYISVFYYVEIYLVTFAFGSDIVNVVEVKTPSGWVRGYEELYDGGQLYRFVKIPYAQPPIGDLRFQKTRPIKEWEGVKGIRDANSPQCSQLQFPLHGVDALEISEDCLFLNIYVPGKISEARNLPVMVWIHGGGFMIGGGSQYKPQKLVLGGGVIVVTINYRLGLLGFLTLHDPLAPGNYGLWDQIEAFKWVQKSIAAFGGNPKSVTIFGESAGGMSVSLQTLIPSNEGLFQRAISQSGVVSFYSISQRQEEKKFSNLLLERTNCAGKEEVTETLKCLREVPAENITSAIFFNDFQVPLNSTFQIGSLVPTVDGDLIKENLMYPKSWDDETYRFFRSIDYISGTLDGEGNLGYFSLAPSIQEHFKFNTSVRVPKSILCEVFAPVFVETVAGNFPELTQEICDFYTTSEGDLEQSLKVCDFYGDSWFVVPSNIMLGIHAKDNDKAKTFQYLVTKQSPYPFIQNPAPWYKKAGHGEELHLIFNMTYNDIPEQTLKQYDLAADEILSKNVIKYWTNFAKNGNPNSDGLPNWSFFDTITKKYAILDTLITEGEDLKPGATHLLRKVLDKGRTEAVHDEL